MKTDRRAFVTRMAGLAGAGYLMQPARALGGAFAADQIASNVYPWFTFYQRQGREWAADLDTSLEAFARSGIKGYEPSLTSPDQVAVLVPLLEKHGLHMRSIYVGANLHEPDEAPRSIDNVIAIAEAARKAGVEVIVSNPSPIGWGTQEDKTDAQLEFQAANLDRLGAELRTLGVVLAYHNHDAEMRRSAREFHHMMLGTDPQHLSLCLDAHWIYRGSGNSQVALFDIVRLYGSRIVELHLRQSGGGVWSEVFDEGDIDYTRLADELRRLGVRPLVVLEQCVEAQSPYTMEAVEAHVKSLRYAEDLFGPLAG